MIDTSAVVAYATRETEATRIEHVIASTPNSLISAVSVFECKMVLAGRLGAAAGGIFERFARIGDLRIVAFDVDQLDIAFDAFLRYGKSTGHPARLNMGDRAAYALARSRGMPLLFKGAGFRLTDVRPAL